MIVDKNIKEVRTVGDSIVKIMGEDELLWEIPKPFKLYKLQDATVFDKINPPSGSQVLLYTYKLKQIGDDEMMWFALPSSKIYEKDFQVCCMNEYSGKLYKIEKFNYEKSIFEYNGITFYRLYWEFASYRPNKFYLSLDNNPTSVTHNAIILKESTIEQEQEILKQFSF